MSRERDQLKEELSRPGRVRHVQPPTTDPEVLRQVNLAIALGYGYLRLTEQGRPVSFSEMILPMNWVAARVGRVYVIREVRYPEVGFPKPTRRGNVPTRLRIRILPRSYTP